MDQRDSYFDKNEGINERLINPNKSSTNQMSSISVIGSGFAGLAASSVLAANELMKNLQFKS